MAIDSLFKAGISEQVLKKPASPRMVVDVRGVPLKDGEMPGGENTHLRYTTGLYWLKFKPMPKGHKLKELPYVIVSDIFENGKFRVKSYSDVCLRSKKWEDIKFLIRFTNLSAVLFAVANNNIDLAIPFSLDIARYVRNNKGNLSFRPLGHQNWVMLNRNDTQFFPADRKRVEK